MIKSQAIDLWGERAMTLNKRFTETRALTTVAVLAAIGGVCGAAYAGHDHPIPEPSILSLFGVGFALAILVYVRNRRK
jgi:hypothetical protein